VNREEQAITPCQHIIVFPINDTFKEYREIV